MEKKKDANSIPSNNAEEAQAPFYGFVSKSEEEKLLEDMYRPDMEKLQLFTRMLRRNAILKKGIIHHKSI
jgi:hypothetical protein